MNMPLRPHREVSGLEWAIPWQRPEFGREGRRSPAQRAGLRFQRAVARALPEATEGPWFKFCDRAGLGYCQPDLVLTRGQALWVLECKLTYVPSAETQLEQLYLPVVSAATGKQVRGVVVCRNLTPLVAKYRLVEDLAEAMLRPPEFGISILQWLGRGPFPRTI